MKILLVDPAYRFWQFSPFGASMPNLSFVYLGTYLKHKGYKVEILDMNAERIGYEKLPEILKEKKPDVVGVPSAMTCHVPQSFRVVRTAKAVNPEIVTVCGGIVATLASERLMRECPELDFIVRGDGEITTVELLQALGEGRRDFSHILGLTWRDGDKIIRNPDRPPIMDLDSLPLLDWSLVDFSKYWFDLYPPKWGPQALLTISRGCPYGCRFCSPKLAAGRWREMSPRRALEEIKQLYHKWGRRMLWLFDLTFGIKRDATEELLEGILREGLKMNFEIFTRADLVIKRKDLLPLMRRAGIRIASIGMETPLRKDIEKSGKVSANVDYVRIAKEAAKLLRKHDIDIWATYMWGDVDHTPEDVAAIWKFADELDCTIAVFCFITPHPGTPYYEMMKDHLLSEDLSWFSEDNPVLKNLYMTPDQMRILEQEMLANYYLKPSRLLRHAVFGSEFARWWYRFLMRTWREQAPTIYKMWRERMGWKGYNKESEEELRKWARKVLGVPAQTRIFQKLIKSIVKLLPLPQLPEPEMA